MDFSIKRFFHYRQTDGNQKSYSGSKDWWDELKKEELESINRGLKDIEEGRVHPHETAKKL